MSFPRRFLALVPIVALAVAGCSEDTSSTRPTGAGGSGAAGAGGSGTGGSGAAGGGGSGATGGGGGGGGIELGEPIVAPNETWTWVPFDDAVCGNGEPTGIGVNLTDKSKNAIIFMMGGGACWNYLTCYVVKTASNLDTGYQDAEFQSDAQGLLTTSLFDRTDPANPVRDYNMVFVPYCTGDVHAGSRVTDYNGNQTYHMGYSNMTAFLKRIIPTFPDADRIIVSGSSAGGFGAALNWWRVQEGFPGARVDLIDDSGPALPQPYMSDSLQTAWRDAWDLNSALPADCTGCDTALDAIYAFYEQKLTNQRAALLSYTQDTVISAFFQISTTEFEQGLNELTTTRLEGIPQFRYYYLGASGHVLLNDPANVTQSGVVLQDWLTQMLEDDPSWASVHP